MVQGNSALAIRLSSSQYHTIGWSTLYISRLPYDAVADLKTIAILYITRKFAYFEESLECNSTMLLRLKLKLSVYYLKFSS